ncbi:M14 family metallopeptidase [Brevibacillus dissolubilis]|uniref:M14 family metallopeptidase n=1 Tax=Brevibacillus dissolubilis TaxID=1844116 RepID=UPI00111659BE|nr:M14 family metallopeptidase [Brevibacillus dissolubilis]
MKNRFVKHATAILVATGVAISGFTVIPLADTAHAASNAITLYRITTDEAHTVSQLEQYGIDIWEVQPNFVEAPLTPEQISQLQADQWTYKMSRQTNGPSFDSAYRTYDSIQKLLVEKAKQYPKLAEVVTIGYSFEGQPILAMKLTNERNNADKPKSLWIGGTHAREIAPPEVMLAYIDRLLNGYGTDADATWMLDSREVWIVPVLNPDGHRKAEQLLNWRKNTDIRWGSDGVDLNRNYNEKATGIWGNPAYGTSTNPFSSIYCGPYAFSEPETAAIQQLIESVMGPTGTPEDVPNGFQMVVDMHSFGNLIMWPWNWTKDVTQLDAAQDIARMEKIGRKFSTYNTYKPQIGSKLYATTGDTTDWAYGYHKIPSFTFEIAKSFWPSGKELPSLIEENMQPFLYGVKIQDQPYQRVEGPDVLQLQTSVINGQVVVTGTANDTGNGSQKIQAVEVFVGKLGQSGTGKQAVLGNSTNAGSIQTFTTMFPAEGLSSGKQLLIVQAQDENGAWGAPSAVWVQIP